MANPELDLDAVNAALKAKAALPEESEEITNENALAVIANAIVGMERHLNALVYLALTYDSEKTQLTFIPDVFHAIYDGSDPFAEVDEIIARSKAPSPLTPAKDDAET